MATPVVAGCEAVDVARLVVAVARVVLGPVGPGLFPELSCLMTSEARSACMVMNESPRTWSGSVLCLQGHKTPT